ncbi:uncharacterized protein PG986_012920 [Apiospora aurea]|uniref:Uncharacterized protein n=1 Tax=Apiospora aurea TaxID=335848 RepID=A0ABR1Q227_9PEZI
MEEKLLAVSSRVGKQLAADIVSNAAETSSKIRADCTKRRKRKVVQVWLPALEPFLDQIKSQLLEGPFADGPRLAWETLFQVLTLWVKEWEQGEEPEWEDEEEVEGFHEEADELMCAIWWAQHRKSRHEQGRKTWDWLREVARRDEVADLQDASQWSEDRYPTIGGIMEDEPQFSPSYHSQAPPRTTNHMPPSIS